MEVVAVDVEVHLSSDVGETRPQLPHCFDDAVDEALLAGDISLYEPYGQPLDANRAIGRATVAGTVNTDLTGWHQSETKVQGPTGSASVVEMAVSVAGPNTTRAAIRAVRRPIERRAEWVFTAASSATGAIFERLLNRSPKSTWAPGRVNGRIYYL